jgi:hypothetical protein
MHVHLHPPTVERVQTACLQFDREQDLAEQTLLEIFRLYPTNEDPRGVLLKVLAVNSLHHTCIFALDQVAKHIHAHHQEIDAALADGSPAAVDHIAKIKINGKIYNFYSFATRYCNWQNAGAFPMYDAHVDHYLWTLQQQDHFASFLHPDLWDYAKFRRIMTDFRNFHGLKKFSFKEIDKFLYVEAMPPRAAVPEPERGGPGAFDYYPAEELAN